LALLVMERKGIITPKAWILAIGLQIIVSGSGFVAMELGEQDEEKVERFVDEAAIENHEERGEVFVWASVGALALTMAAAILKKVPALKIVALIGSVALLGPLYLVGHSGGELVYEHGAA